MPEIATWWAAAAGYAPPREAVDANAGLDRAQRRAARRAVRRGEAVTDPAAARLTVALARLALRHRPSWALIAFFAVMVVGWAGLAVSLLASGNLLPGAFFALMTPFGVWTLARLRPRAFEVARTAERLNRDVLALAGQPYSEDPHAAEPVMPPPPALIAAAAALWVFYDVFYGVITEALDGNPLALGDVVAGGAVFATFMVAANLTFMRLRTKRQAQRPIA